MKQNKEILIDCDPGCDGFMTGGLYPIDGGFTAG